MAALGVVYWTVWPASVPRARCGEAGLSWSCDQRVAAPTTIRATTVHTFHTSVYSAWLSRYRRWSVPRGETVVGRKPSQRGFGAVAGACRLDA